MTAQIMDIEQNPEVQNELQALLNETESDVRECYLEMVAAKHAHRDLIGVIICIDGEVGVDVILRSQVPSDVAAMDTFSEAMEPASEYPGLDVVVVTDDWSIAMVFFVGQA